MREIRTLRVMWRELETGLRRIIRATAPVPDPTSMIDARLVHLAKECLHRRVLLPAHMGVRVDQHRPASEKPLQPFVEKNEGVVAVNDMLVVE